MQITKQQQEEISNILNWSLKKVFKILNNKNEEKQSEKQKNDLNDFKESKKSNIELL